MKFLSLAALGAVSDENVIKMMTFLFQWMWVPIKSKKQTYFYEATLEHYALNTGGLVNPSMNK